MDRMNNGTNERSNSPLENYKVIFRRSTPKGGGGQPVRSPRKRSDCNNQGLSEAIPLGQRSTAKPGGGLI